LIRRSTSSASGSPQTGSPCIGRSQLRLWRPSGTAVPHSQAASPWAIREYLGGKWAAVTLVPLLPWTSTPNSWGAMANQRKRLRDGAKPHTGRRRLKTRAQQHNPLTNHADPKLPLTRPNETGAQRCKVVKTLRARFLNLVSQVRILLGAPTVRPGQAGHLTRWLRARGVGRKTAL